MCIKQTRKKASKRPYMKNTQSKVSSKSSGKSQLSTIRIEELEDKTQREQLERKNNEKRLNEVFKAYGAEPNLAMATKIARDKAEHPKKQDVEKFGDICFSYSSREPKKAEDDTQYELPPPPPPKPIGPLKRLGYTYNKIVHRKQPKYSPGRTDKYTYRKTNKDQNEDLYGDVDFDPPNEMNFMANLKDIQYVAHDMIRTVNRTKLPAQHQINTESPSYTADLSLLEKNPRFSWTALTANSLLANALCLPTQQEKEHVNTAQDYGKPVYVAPNAIDLQHFIECDDADTHTANSFQVIGKKAETSKDKEKEKTGERMNVTGDLKTNSVQKDDSKKSKKSTNKVQPADSNTPEDLPRTPNNNSAMLAPN